MLTTKSPRSPGRRVARAASIALCSVLGACSSADQAPADPPPAPVDPPPATGAAPITLEWSACDQAPGSGKADAQCALVDLPRDHGKPEGPRLRIAAKRVVPSRPLRAQVFVVDGGPGGSAVNGFVALGGRLLGRGDVAVYAVDHRGMGGSTPLDCPAQTSEGSDGGEAITDDEWPACIAELRAREGENLPYLSTTQSMEDIAWMIEKTRTPGVPVYVYGGSYGTYAAIRYMKLHPEQADGVILEGISPPGRDFDPYDVEMDGAARELFALCAADASCRSHFDEDPWKVAGDVVASFDRGHCRTLGLDGDGARAFLGNFTFFWPIRDYLPILVHRMRRCERRDVTALVSFYQSYARLTAGLGPGPLAFQDGRHVTDAAFFHVAVSEMWHTASAPPPEAQVLADWRKLTMSTGLTVRIAKRQPGWPAYPRGPEVDASLPKFDRPLLMLQGTLDAATAVGPARRLRDHYRAPGQSWVELPTGGHQIVGASPTPDGKDCGLEILHRFLDDPRAPLDVTCAKDAAPIRFDGTAANNAKLLGVADGWDG